MSALATVEVYLRALNQHDLKAAGELLSDDVAMVFVGTEYKMNKPQIMDALSWDVGTNGEFSYEILNAELEQVVLELAEINDFLRLLDMPPLQAQMQFTVNERSLIQSISYESKGTASADPKSVHRALEEPVDWARTNAREELDAIYPDGQLHYTRKSGERWVRLLRDWKDSMNLRS